MQENTEPPILEMRNVSKHFPGVIALDGIGLDVRQGEIHALTGENGAGKSTLIKILAGVYGSGDYTGDILLHGRSVRFQNIQDASRAGIAVIHQELSLIEEMTVAENLFLGVEPTRGGFMDWNRIHHDAGTLLHRLRIELDPAAQVKHLGIGQKQLVEIAKALSKHSIILLLDEPTAALTEAEVQRLLNILRELKKQHIACIYISHKLDEVFAIADRITVLRDGKTITTMDRMESSKDALISAMVGRDIHDFFPRGASAHGRTLLDIRNLTVADNANRKKNRLEGITLQAHAGEVLGIGGLMGSGRSELLFHLMGLYGLRVCGDILLDGRPLHNRHPLEVIQQGLVMVSEDRKRWGLIMEQDVAFNLSLSSLSRYLSCGFIDRNREVAANKEYCEKLGIKTSGMETCVATLSGGNQQKVVLAKALMSRPKVVLLDEPTRGIDVGAKVEVYGLINDMTDQGKAVIIVSSELPELMGMSDRMVILSAGKIGGVFTKEEADQEAILAAAMAHH